jgi:hypothetical protein
MLLLSRRWLLVIAEDMGRQISLSDSVAKDVAKRAFSDALALLKLMPWHLRLMVSTAEIAASLWYLFDWLAHPGKSDFARGLRNFEKAPFLAPSLLRLYRSLVAASWFEQPEILSAFNLEPREARQTEFRSLRNKAA